MRRRDVRRAADVVEPGAAALSLRSVYQAKSRRPPQTTTIAAPSPTWIQIRVEDEDPEHAEQQDRDRRTGELEGVAHRGGVYERDRRDSASSGRNAP